MPEHPAHETQGGRLNTPPPSPAWGRGTRGLCQVPALSTGLAPGTGLGRRAARSSARAASLPHHCLAAAWPPRAVNGRAEPAPHQDCHTPSRPRASLAPGRVSQAGRRCRPRSAPLHRATAPRHRVPRPAARPARRCAPQGPGAALQEPAPRPLLLTAPSLPYPHDFKTALRRPTAARAPWILPPSPCPPASRQGPKPRTAAARPTVTNPNGPDRKSVV